MASTNEFETMKSDTVGKVKYIGRCGSTINTQVSSMRLNMVQASNPTLPYGYTHAVPYLPFYLPSVESCLPQNIICRNRIRMPDHFRVRVGNLQFIFQLLAHFMHVVLRGCVLIVQLPAWLLTRSVGQCKRRIPCALSTGYTKTSDNIGSTLVTGWFLS